MKEQIPKFGDFVYIKHRINGRIMLVDQVTNIGLKSYFTRNRHLFDFYGEPKGATGNVYGDCLAYICNENEKEFFSKLYHKSIEDSLSKDI